MNRVTSGVQGTRLVLALGEAVDTPHVRDAQCLGLHVSTFLWELS